MLILGFQLSYMGETNRLTQESNRETREANERAFRLMEESNRLTREALEESRRQAGESLAAGREESEANLEMARRTLAERERWTPGKLAPKATGVREGWWGMSANAEKFLDEAVTWREVGYNMAAGWGDAAEKWESLPPWARATLDKHAGAPRPEVYDLAAFEAGETHDPLWNAAQGQLAEEGRIHNYLRMLWGKKVLEWSASPREALATLIELNNKYALDGRDPNSASGIFWCLGRYDRPWAPERPIFGVVRYMSSESTRKKMRVDAYVRRYAPGGARQLRLV